MTTIRNREYDDNKGRRLRRLLQALNEADARGQESGIEDGVIVVAAPRNGVTMVRARLPIGAAEQAVAQGLAKWEQEGSARRLRLTNEGRSHARRLAAREKAPPFLAQHAPLERRVIDKGATPVLVDEGESPLAWLARRKDRDGRPFLSAAHVEAGERFRRDVTLAQILQRVTADWEATISAPKRSGGAGANVTEAAIDARRRLSRALDAVGPDLAGLLIDVCACLKGLELVEAERGWPRRSAKLVLKIALDRLAAHYGISLEARGPSSAHRLLHWGAEDYRPAIS